MLNKQPYLLWLLLSLLLLISPPAVQANAAPPPPVVWFTFVDEMGQPVRLEGVQLLGCSTPACEAPAILQQAGRCEAEACLAGEPQLKQLFDVFECAGHRCRSMAYRYGLPYFKLIVQLPEGARTSQTVEGLPPDNDWGVEEAWRVTVTEAGLSLAADTVPPKPLERFGLFLGALLLTQVIELGVAALYMWLWLKLPPAALGNRLGMIFLINLVTFPVVWFFFPSLGQFQPDGLRKTGVAVLFFASFYGTMLAMIYRAEIRKWRLIFLSGTLVSLPIAAFLWIFLLLIFNYGNYRVPAAGLPVELIVLSSELFAVVCEASLLSLLSRGALPLRQTAGLSLFMNLVSFMAGVAVFGS